MKDITHKVSTHRSATAQAIVSVGDKSTIDAVQNNTVPKGNVFEMAKTAGLFAVKNTSNAIPDCHPMPVEHTSIEFDIVDNDIHILVNAATIYKTGIEVEVMHGASVVALTIYDMLKPIDKNIEIKSIKLITKKGGKSDYLDKFRNDLTAAVIVCSDSISAGKKEDKAGIGISERLKEMSVSVLDYDIIPDEKSNIEKKVLELCDKNIDLIIFTGGTGLSARDITPEAVQPLLDREIPGMMEAARNYGQQRTPYSMLSRGIAGVRGNSLILTFPGSTRGALETMDAIFPYALHVFRILKGVRHD